MRVRGRAGLRVRPEAGNAAWLTGERVLQTGLGFLVGAAVARHLGVGGFGTLAFAVALGVLVQPFASFAQPLAVRDLAKGEVPEGTVIGSVLVMHAAVTAAAVAGVASLLVLVPDAAPPGAVGPALLVLTGLLLRPVSGAFDYWFQARLRAREAVLARVVTTAYLVVSRLVAVVLEAPIAVFAAVMGAEALVGAVVLAAAYRRAGGSLGQVRFRRDYATSLAREGLPLLGSSVAVILYSRIDQAMLGALTGPDDVGVYALAVSMAELLFIVPVLLHTVLMPKMTVLWESDRAAYHSRLQGLFSFCVAGSVLLGLPMAVLGAFAIRLAYGEQFAASVPVFLVLLLGLPFVFLGTVQGLWSAHARRNGVALARVAFAAGLNIGLNFWVLPRHGAMGAAVTTVVAFAVAAFLGNAVFPSCRGVFRMQVRAFALRGLVPTLRDGLRPRSRV